MNFLECAFSEQFFEMHFDLGEFLNLFCVFPLLSVCVRTRSEEFGFVCLGSTEIWNLCHVDRTLVEGRVREQSLRSDEVRRCRRTVSC